MLQIDLTTLTKEQLTALALINPEEVQAELDRRDSFENMTEFLSALAQAALDFESNSTANPHLRANRLASDTNLLMIIRSGLKLAEDLPIPFVKPTLKPLTPSTPTPVEQAPDVQEQAQSGS